MNLSPIYLEALDYCRTLPRSVFRSLVIESMILYGSATYEGCLIEKMSDLDILVLSKDATAQKLDSILDAINCELSGLAMPILKPPVILRDYIGERIEFNLEYKGVVLDFTIMKTLISSRESLLVDAVHDSAEILIGSIVERGNVIYGNQYKGIPLNMVVFPFYDDSIRLARLATIEKYLASKMRRIEFLLQTKDLAVIDYFFRYRPIFLKWIFCYFRQYPVNFYKHLPLQLSWLKSISFTEKQIILLQSGETLEDSIYNFVRLYDSLCRDLHSESV